MPKSTEKTADEKSSERPIIVNLTGQVAIVTGASRGIGKTIAEVLAEAGAKVACVARTADKLNETVQAIRAAGGTADALACDVTNSDSVQKLVDGVLEKWERLDIVVNNAGITRDTLVPRMQDDDWDAVIDTNLKGTFLFTRAATRPMMQARYGRIINIASVSGIMGNPGQSNYSASKAGVLGFTRTVAKELASRKVTVNAISPGFIETEMTGQMNPAILEEAKKRIPAKRLGQTRDIAYAVLFLASPAASYITGQGITIDGGLVA